MKSDESAHKFVLFCLLTCLVMFTGLGVSTGSILSMFVAGLSFAVLLEEMLQLSKYKYRGEYRGMNDEVK